MLCLTDSTGFWKIRYTAYLIACLMINIFQFFPKEFIVFYDHDFLHACLLLLPFSLNKFQNPAIACLYNPYYISCFYQTQEKKHTSCHLPENFYFLHLSNQPEQCPDPKHTTEKCNAQYQSIVPPDLNFRTMTELFVVTSQCKQNAVACPGLLLLN